MLPGAISTTSWGGFINVSVEMALEDLEVGDMKLEIKSQLGLKGVVELLVSERGPVFEDMVQFKHIKVVHVGKISSVIAVVEERKPMANFQVQTSWAVVSKKDDMSVFSSGAAVSKVNRTLAFLKRRTPAPIPSLTPSKLANLGRELQPPPSVSKLVPMRH